MFFNKERVASNMLKLAQNPISIPVSTVGMERIFSALMMPFCLTAYDNSEQLALQL